MRVEPIPNHEARPWILKKHYAKRCPPIQYAYALYTDNVPCGVVTYGVPATNDLCEGICGPEYRDRVVELNRLCLETSAKNAASFLVGNSLRLLPQPRIVVSYADTKMGHVGYVYQATNFLYTGLSRQASDYMEIGREHEHPRSITSRYGTIARARKVLGDKLARTPRSRKHRYIIFLGNKRDIKDMRKHLRYPIEPYPKGDTHRYDASAHIDTQPTLF